MVGDTALEIRKRHRESMETDAPVDLLGRRQLRHRGAATFLRSIPHMMDQLSRIPSEFWALDVNDEGYSEAVVACPCGNTPHIEVGTMEQCSCPRIFFFGGPAVFVANSPKTSVPRWQQIARSYLRTAASS